MFFLIPLVLSGGVFYLAYDVALTPEGELFALLLCIIGVSLMAFALVIAKTEADIRRRDRYVIDRIRQEEAEIHELTNDISDFLREFQANQEGDRK